MTNHHAPAALLRHDFYGHWAPTQGVICPGQHTFSLGVFQWVLAANGVDRKRGPVKVRVKGSTSYPEKVYRKAQEIAKALDEGTYDGPRTVSAF